MRIPFDSLCLAAVCSEIEPFIGGRLQKIVQPNESTVYLGIHAKGSDGWLLLSIDPNHSRVHFSSRRPANPPDMVGFCSQMRAHLDDARLVEAQQRGFDRILDLTFEGKKGQRRLIAELMNKHSNLMLVGEEDRILASAKTVPPIKSVRPIGPGRIYSPPPIKAKPSLINAYAGGDLSDYEGASPFLVKLIEAIAAEKHICVDEAVEQIRIAAQTHQWQPVLAIGQGAYPIAIDSLGIAGHLRASYSVALESYLSESIPQEAAKLLQSSLLAQIKRVVEARKSALEEMQHAISGAGKASRMQLMGELLLAYGPTIPSGAELFSTLDYDGNELEIPLDPDENYRLNADRFFAKAKKAKTNAVGLAEQIQRIENDLTELTSFWHKVETADLLSVLEDLRDEADRRRWLHRPTVVSKKGKIQLPFDGHKIRELLGPGGVTILVGETAPANDYLTTRVAKPNDWWLHLRGGTSSHVVIPTANKPDRISREVLVYAATVCVQHSPSKHANLVAVDYTLRKYVRKPRGSAIGFVVYTNEKTLHIDSPGKA